MGGIILIQSIWVVVVVCQLMVLYWWYWYWYWYHMVRTDNGFYFFRYPQKDGMRYIFGCSCSCAVRNDSFVANHKFIIHSYIYTHTCTHTSKDTPCVGYQPTNKNRPRIKLVTKLGSNVQIQASVLLTTFQCIQWIDVTSSWWLGPNSPIVSR
jgi:hypothetical protein